MKSELADRGACDDDLDTRICDLFEDLQARVLEQGHTNHWGSNLFEVLLLPGGEVEHLLLVVDKDGTLCFCLRNVEAAREYRDFRFVHFLDHAYSPVQRLYCRCEEAKIPSGSRPKTIPRTTRLPARLPPMIFTTRTLSTLKFLGFGGITANAASATRDASVSSYPYCFDAIAGLSAVARVGCVSGVGNSDADNSEERDEPQQ